MATFISILIIIVAILLILIVLVQNPKGGGLSSSFSSSNQVLGVKQTADFLEKTTWGLAGALLVLSIIAASFTGAGTVSTENSPAESATKKIAGEKALEAPIAPPPAGLENNNIAFPSDSTK